MHRMFLGCLSIITLSSCTLFEAKTVECKPQISYSGYSVTVTGLEVPVGGQKLFKMGELRFDPEQIQVAKDLTQALDLLQFSDCQFALLVPKEQVLKVRQHREATLNALAEVLTAMNAAPTVSEHQQAVKAGQQKLAELQNEAHAHSGSVNPNHALQPTP